MSDLQLSSLFAILDGAQFDDVHAVLAELDGAHQVSLFSGRKGRELSDVAPHLVWHPEARELLAWFLSHTRDRPAGIMIVSAMPFPELRRHLAEQLIVAFEDGSHALFRYYDPRVFASATETLTREQFSILFAPVRVVLAASPGGESLLAHVIDEGGDIEFPMHLTAEGSDMKKLASTLLEQHASFFAANASH